MSDLIILYNCASHVAIDAYYHTYSFPTLLHPFLRASDNAMLIHAKLILAQVSSVLTDDEIHESMKLSSSSADELISILGEASTAADRKSNGFTVIELARGLKRLLVCNENSNLISKTDLFPIFVSVFSCGSVQEQIASCELLWSLQKSTKFKSELCKSDFSLPELLERMKESQNSSLSMLASCTLWNLMDTYEQGEQVWPWYHLYNVRVYNTAGRGCMV